VFSHKDVATNKRYATPKILNSSSAHAVTGVYSFAVLFWQMMALKELFKRKTAEIQR